MPSTEHLPAVTPNAGRSAPWHSSRQRSGAGDGGRSARIKYANTSIFIAAILSIISANGEEIIPKGWVTPDQLKQAERPIQEQLDTGKAMGPTAWDMASLKDARLLLIYLTIYERLPDNANRIKLKSEQESWLEQRKKAVRALADPNGGSMVTLDQASNHMDLTEKRIQTLSKRLEQMKKQNKSLVSTATKLSLRSGPSMTAVPQL